MVVEVAVVHPQVVVVVVILPKEVVHLMEELQEVVHPQVAQSLGKSDNGGEALASSFSQLGVPLTAHKLLLL